MLRFSHLFPLFTLFFSLQSISQNNTNTNKIRINDALESYYKLDREKIHLHLNKNQFITTDDIWFKGYITEKKSGLPYDLTSNTYVNLLDENGLILQSQLFYAENSTFEGSFKLKKNFKTGVYYLQTYTNYMNNFSEDESSKYKIVIINPAEEKIATERKIDYASLTITLFPESGSFLENTFNTIAVKLSDCHNNGMMVQNAKVVDSKGNSITDFSTNEFGYGKFDITPNHSETYKIIINTDKKTIEKTLPQPSLTGITFSANSYTFQDKVILKLKTNSRSLETIGKLPYTIIIQKDNSATSLDFSFDEKTEKTITLPSNSLSFGINTIRLLDKDLLQIGERVVYRAPYFNRQTSLSILKQASDSIHIKGNTSLKLAEISISVLPEKTLFDNNTTSFYGNKIFNDLKESLPNERHFINDFSKKKHYELDNILMTSQSKYEWRNILNNTPQEKHEFDVGLTIRGTVNSDLSDRASYKINMNSIVLGFNEFTSLNDKNEFYFKNLYVTDSATIHFNLLNKNAKTKELKMYSAVSNGKRKFNKPFKPQLILCSDTFEKTTSETAFPISVDATMLDSITINTQKRKNELTKKLKFSNAMAKGYKITDKEQTSYRDVLQFIASHGYNVSTQAGTVTIVSQSFTTVLGSKSPQVFLDDAPVHDFNLLMNYSLEYIDEIYINKRGFGGGMDAANGIIRIYSKTGVNGARSGIKIKSGSLLIDGGFQQATNFKTPKYTSFRNSGFNHYGTINWIPKVQTNENGDFTFAFPNLYQTSVKVIIEGISSDGQTISEIKTITIP
ncbi:hypothetical protein ABGT15_01470 [Flavobacterium enshiense]|uniref:hypothetical protein n=1 Tax=Flavobacterium enshiense TaxID=1341165 RepID=UPI00345D382D